MTVDELQVLITANTNELRKEINNTNQVISGLQKSTSKSAAGISSSFGKIKTAIVALGIGKVIKDSIQSGMDAIETESLFDTVMGDNAEAVKAWSKDVSDALGLSAVNMQRNIGVIYNMTSSMGVAEDNALKMSKGISVLAEDMASLYNLDSAEAFNKLKAGITGETEPLKSLGILVDENTVKQVAYSEGIAENGAELTQQQKVLARYVAILKQTGSAQGDLARTIDSPTNQLRQLKQNVKDAGIALSQFFMPIVKFVLPWLNALAKVATEALNSLKPYADKLAKFLGVSSSESSEETKKTKDNVGGIGDNLDDANDKAKKLKKSLAGFDEMNVLQDNSDTDSGDVVATGGDTGYELGDYETMLELLNNKTNEIAEKIKSAFAGVGSFLKTTWDEVWNSAPVQSFVGAVVEYGGFLWEYWSTLGGDLVENIGTTWNNIKDNMGTTIANMSALWTQFWTDIQAGIEKWGQPIIDGVSKLFNSIWTDAIDPAVQLITQKWADFSGILLELWNKHGQPLIDNIGEFVTKTTELFQKIWDDILAPIIKPFLEDLKWLWDTHISGMIKKVGDFVGKLVNGALEIYNKFIQPILLWLIDKLSPCFAWIGSIISGVFTTIVAFISGVFTTIVAFISDRVGAIIGFFGGLIDFITGIFTGNWEKAWDGVKTMFKNVIDGIVAIFKFPINLIIDAINAFTAGLNKIQIPDWVPGVGGKGINIPKIPKLAQGGIIDSPTVAVVGEAGKEAVMPLERNTGWIDQLANKIGETIGGGSGNINLTVKLGEDTIFNKFIEYGKAKAFETNGEVAFA